MKLSQIIAQGFHKTFTGSDITITEAKMKACEEFFINGKAVTKRKQEALWGRYIPCDGITNGANTSIDTGVKAADNIEMLVRVKAITGSFYILQARQSTNATIYGITGSQTNDTIIFFGVTSGITRTTGHIYTIKGTLVNGAVTLYVKDETAGTEDTKTGTLTGYTFPSPTTIKLFGDANKLDAGATVYRAYIKINGQMAWDMYPASDTTTAFNSIIAYDDVTHAKSTVVSGNITGGSLIQPISYVETDRTVYCDTGLIGSEKTKITIDFQKTNNTANYMHTAGNGATKTAAISCNIGIGDDTLSRFGAESENLHLFNDLNRHNLIIANDGFIADGTNVWTPNASAFTTSDNILLFAVTRVAVDRFIGKVYAASIEEDGVLVRKYQPVRIGTTVELLDLVNWQFATRTGTFTAGADIPYTELCPDIIETNVGDAWYGSRNEFNLNTITSGKYLNSAGVETSNTLWNVSDYMPVVGGETYYQRLRVAGTSQRTCWYTANKTLISVSSQVAGGTLTAPANAAYARMSVYCLAIDKDDLTYAMFYKGVDAPEEYIPYEPVGLHPSGEQRVVTEGINLVDFNETRVNSSTWATADKTKGFEIIADVYNKVVGNSLGANGNCFGAFVPCKKGESVSLNFFNYEPYYGRCFYCEVDADFKVLTTPIQYSNGTSSITQKTFTATNDDCIGFAIEWYLNAGQTRNYTKENYMVVSGTTAPTFYEPYSAPQIRTITTFLPSATSFINAQKAANNAQCDWKFKVLDGTEIYAWGNPSVTLRWTGMETLKTGIAPVCNVLEGVASFTTGAQIIVYNSTTFRLRIPRITGSDDAKQIITDLYKAGKPMILAYPLATPEVTTVVINPVSLANGTNRVTASSGTVKVTANVRVI